MGHLLYVTSPILVMAACNVVARVSKVYISSHWKWIPNLLVYWFVVSFFIGIDYTDLINMIDLTLENWWVGLLALAVGFIPLPILISNRHLLKSFPIFISWVLFAVINPFFEELYWRGFLSAATESWPFLLSLFYINVLFSLHHKIAWEGISPMMGDKAVLLSTFIMGIDWSISLLYCHTIIWAIVSHVLVDLFNLAVPVYMNLYNPYRRTETRKD